MYLLLRIIKGRKTFLLTCKTNCLINRYLQRPTEYTGWVFHSLLLKRINYFVCQYFLLGYIWIPLGSQRYVNVNDKNWMISVVLLIICISIVGSTVEKNLTCAVNISLMYPNLQSKSICLNPQPLKSTTNSPIQRYACLFIYLFFNDFSNIFKKMEAEIHFYSEYIMWQFRTLITISLGHR